MCIAAERGVGPHQARAAVAGHLSVPLQLSCVLILSRGTRARTPPPLPCPGPYRSRCRRLHHHRPLPAVPPTLFIVIFIIMFIVIFIIVV